MADTLDNIPLPRNTYVDLYDASGITPGVKIRVQNLGVGSVNLTISLAEPTENNAFTIIQRETMAVNDAGDSGAWAISVTQDGLVNVAVVV